MKIKFEENNDEKKTLAIKNHFNEEEFNTENRKNLNYSIKEKKNFNLKILKNFIGNSEYFSNVDHNSYKETKQNLNIESQELSKNVINQISNRKDLDTNQAKENPTKKLSLYEKNINKSELLKIEDIQCVSRLLKKKIENQKTSKCFKIRKLFEKVLDNNIYILFMMFLTIIILFISDIQNGWLEPKMDTPIDIVQIVIFSIYFLEIIVTCLCKDGYNFSFFFWLDILSTAYIIQDISFIINPLIGIDKKNL